VAEYTSRWFTCEHLTKPDPANRPLVLGRYFSGNYHVKFGHFVNFLLLARYVPNVAKRSI